MTPQEAEKKPRALVKFYKMGEESSSSSLVPPTPSQDRVCWELVEVPRSRKIKRIPSRIAKPVVGVSEDCTMEAERNWRPWANNGRASPQPSGFPQCPATEWLSGSHECHTFGNEYWHTAWASGKILSFPLSLCSFQCQVSSICLLILLRHSDSQNIGKEQLRLKYSETNQHICLSHTHRMPSRAGLRTQGLQCMTYTCFGLNLHPSQA